MQAIANAVSGILPLAEQERVNLRKWELRLRTQEDHDISDNETLNSLLHAQIKILCHKIQLPLSELDMLRQQDLKVLGLPHTSGQ